MKKLLLLIAVVFLLLFYVWERSRSFQLVQTVTRLEETKRHGLEDLSMLRTDIEHLSSFTRIEAVGRSEGLAFPKQHHGSDSTAQGR